MQSISVGVHPFFGEVYSFPWKRSPHAAIQEYNECFGNFDLTRTTTLKSLERFDWVSEMGAIFKTSSSKIVKISVLRIILQMIKIQASISIKVIKNRQMLTIL